MHEIFAVITIFCKPRLRLYGVFVFGNQVLSRSAKGIAEIFTWPPNGGIAPLLENRYLKDAL